MIIFLYGPDGYRRLARKKELIAAFEKKHSGLGVGYFDMASDSKAPPLDAFAEFARGNALFENAKLAVIENAFDADAEKFAAILAPLGETKSTTVILSENAKPAKGFSFLLKAPVSAEKFEALEGGEWASFIGSEAGKLGLAPSPDAVRFLGTVHKGDSWALVTELQKLAALVSGSLPGGKAAARAVDKGALDALGLEAAPDYWMLLNGMKNFDGRVRLASLERLFALNDPPAKIFNILAAQAGEKAPRMAEYDLAVKSGKLDYEEALLDMALAF